MFTLICARINGWVNNREAGDLRRHCAHSDVIIMNVESVSMSWHRHGCMSPGKDRHCQCVIISFSVERPWQMLPIPCQNWLQKQTSVLSGKPAVPHKMWGNLFSASACVFLDWYGDLSFKINAMRSIGFFDRYKCCWAMYRVLIGCIRGQRPISGRTYFRHICSLGVNFMQLWFFVSNRFLI